MKPRWVSIDAYVLIDSEGRAYELDTLLRLTRLPDPPPMDEDEADE